MWWPSTKRRLVHPGKRHPPSRTCSARRMAGRDGAGLAPHVEGCAPPVLHDGDHGGVATKPAGGLGRQGGAVLELAASFGIAGQHLGVDVDRHQMVVTAAVGVPASGEEALGHGHEGIGLALTSGLRPCGQRFRGTVVHRLRRRLQGLAHQRALLGSEAGAEHEAAVVVVVPLCVAPVVEVVGRVHLVISQGAPVRPHDPLQVRRRAGQGELEQVALVVGRGHPGERPHLGVAQSPGGEGGGDRGELAETMRHPDLLTSRGHVDPTLPVEPMRTAPALPGAPSLPPVELGHQQQPPALGGVEVGGQLGDLTFQPLQGNVVERWSLVDNVGSRQHVLGEPSSKVE